MAGIGCGKKITRSRGLAMPFVSVLSVMFFLCYFCAAMAGQIPSSSFAATAGIISIEDDGAFTGASGSQSGAYSTGTFELKEKIPDEYMITFNVTRLIGESGYPSEFFFRGGAFAVASGSFYFYESE